MGKLIEEGKDIYESDLIRSEKEYAAITPVGHPMIMPRPGHVQEIASSEQLKGFNKKNHYGVDEGEMKDSDEAASMEQYRFDMPYPTHEETKHHAKAAPLPKKERHLMAMPPHHAELQHIKQEEGMVLPKQQEGVAMLPRQQQADPSFLPIKAKPFGDQQQEGSYYIDKDLKLSDEWMREAEELHNAKFLAGMPIADGGENKSSVSNMFSSAYDKLTFDKDGVANYADYDYEKDNKTIPFTTLEGGPKEYNNMVDDMGGETPIGKPVDIGDNKERVKLLENSIQEETKYLGSKDEDVTGSQDNQTPTGDEQKFHHEIQKIDSDDAKTMSEDVKATADDQQQSAILNDPSFTHSSLLEMNIEDGVHKEHPSSNNSTKDAAVVEVAYGANMTKLDHELFINKEDTLSKEVIIKSQDLQEKLGIDLSSNNDTSDSSTKDSKSKSLISDDGEKKKKDEGEKDDMKKDDMKKEVANKKNSDVKKEELKKKEVEETKSKMVDSAKTTKVEEVKSAKSTETKMKKQREKEDAVLSVRNKTSENVPKDDGKLHIFVGDEEGESLHEIEGEVIKDVKPLQSKFHASMKDDLVDNDLRRKEKNGGEKLFIKAKKDSAGSKFDVTIEKQDGKEKRKAAITGYKKDEEKMKYSARPNSK